ncbi:MAG TPA: hypothetical protein VF722_17600 [Gemmatimonadaceae bacterium]|jgi:D-glycero-alpha-D-manno-heptose-7-phosphate kinase
MRLVTARAPARMDFGGGWTDVPPWSTEQGGCVCNAAITLYASVRMHDEHARAPSATSDTALAQAALRRAELGNVTAEVSSDFPKNAGLGGSSAVGVALQAAIARWRGEDIDGAALAERSRDVEVEEMGIAGGRQDHYAAVFGGLLGMRFGERVTIRCLDAPADLVRDISARCIVAYTGESRISGDTITAVMDAYRARERRVVQALRRMGALAGQMIEAFERRALSDVAELVDEHWEYQRALHPSITTPGIEHVIAVARAAGATGCKALGASGGGCVLAIAPAERAAKVRAAMARVAQPLAFTLDMNGVQVDGA